MNIVEKIEDYEKFLADRERPVSVVVPLGILNIAKELRDLCLLSKETIIEAVANEGGLDGGDAEDILELFRMAGL